MIRAIKTDQDFDTEWSPFGSHVVLDIRYMTNGSNFRCYASVPGVSMTSIIMFCCYLAFWTTYLYFETYILDFKLGFEHGLQLVNGVSALNGFFAHLIAIFSCFGFFLLLIFVVVCLKQFLPFPSNLQVNFNELANIYPTALFPSNIYIANLVYCLVIYLYIYGFIEY